MNLIACLPIMFSCVQDALVIEKKGFHIADDLPFTRNFVEVSKVLYCL